MNKAESVSFVLAGLLLGCGAGAAATHHAAAQAPPPSARPAEIAAAPASPSPAPTPVRWQQYCEEMKKTPADLNQLLVQRGNEGWELAAMPFTFAGSGFTGAVCFKRPQ